MQPPTPTPPKPKPPAPQPVEPTKNDTTSGGDDETSDETSHEPLVPPVGPTGNTTEAKDKYDIDIVEFFIKKMPPVPRIAVGVILALLGLALCLFGS